VRFYSPRLPTISPLANGPPAFVTRARAVGVRLLDRKIRQRQEPFALLLAGDMDKAHRFTARFDAWRLTAGEHPSERQRRRTLALIALVVCWATTVGAGVVWVWQYKTAPGAASHPPAVWPASSGLKLSGRTLVATAV
jgi:hypothetical protein